MAAQIHFTPQVLEKIQAHLQGTYPDEGCGFFFGKDGELREVSDFSIADNVHEGERKRRFSIRPEDYLLAEQYATENALDLLGIYHSHPNHPAIPSGTDLENAIPWFSYLIVTTTATAPTDSRSWQLTENGQFEEEILVLHVELAVSSCLG